MIAPEVTMVAPTRPMQTAPRDAGKTLPLLEFELSLDGYSAGEAGFSSAIKEAARTAGGAYLFDLPGADLLDDCSRIAVLRIAEAHDQELRTMLVVLDGAGARVRVAEPDERTEGLVRFAESFVGVLEKI
ncbi:hypothetical protein MRS76_05455 [Rhizobiaceae bacterium n13]|uniref:Uncharacterized protein n=1 Tax=Ferirhizobium litorale TaxID=2927786 RepID=A0AAE3QAY5_9HYPH|nr:hypothetical protein [Fererhizobium litorale]MDI7861394.1 hypothetical protein [Fererhizobium litorale]MDI7921541.1 hypothetical protein [Fererhizobium litorale]